MKTRTLTSAIILTLLTASSTLAMEEKPDSDKGSHSVVQKCTISSQQYQVRYFHPDSQQHSESVAFSNGKLPRVPLFHPEELGELSTPLTIHIPSAARPGLPDLLQNALDLRKIDTLNIFVSAQSIPNSPLIWFPQYGTDGLWAPHSGKYWAIRNVNGALLYSDSQQLRFEGCEPNQFSEREISIHPKGSSSPSDNKEDTIVLSSPFRMQGINPNVGQSVWSGAIYNDGFGDRAIVTLHWFLNPDQHQELSNILADSKGDDVPTLLNRIRKSPAFMNQGAHVQKMDPLLKELETSGWNWNTLQRLDIDEPIKPTSLHEKPSKEEKEDKSSEASSGYSWYNPYGWWLWLTAGKSKKPELSVEDVAKFPETPAFIQAAIELKKQDPEGFKQVIAFLKDKEDVTALNTAKPSLNRITNTSGKYSQSTQESVEKDKVTYLTAEEINLLPPYLNSLRSTLYSRLSEGFKNQNLANLDLTQSMMLPKDK